MTSSTRRRLQGVGLFLLGLAMLVSGVAIKATMIGGFPVLSVLGRGVMFAGVVFAVTGPPAGGRVHDAPVGRPMPRRGKASGSGSFTSRMEVIASGVVSTSNRSSSPGNGQPSGCLCCPFYSPFLFPQWPPGPSSGRSVGVWWRLVECGGGDETPFGCQSGAKWGIVGYRAPGGAPAAGERRSGFAMFLGTYTPKLDDKGQLTLPAVS